VHLVGFIIKKIQ